MAHVMIEHNNIILVSDTGVRLRENIKRQRFFFNIYFLTTILCVVSLLGFAWASYHAFMSDTGGLFFASISALSFFATLILSLYSNEQYGKIEIAEKQFNLAQVSLQDTIMQVEEQIAKHKHTLQHKAWENSLNFEKNEEKTF